MKKSIVQKLFFGLLVLGFANSITAQVTRPTIPTNKVQLVRKNIPTSFSPIAQTYKAAPVLTSNTRFAKSVVPVAEKQYTVSLCSNGTDSDVSYEAYNVNGVAFGAIYFDLGRSTMIFNVNAKADAYYLFELNISSNGSQFSIHSMNLDSKVTSTKEKLSFTVEVKKGNNAINITCDNPWAFASAQITLLKN